tara:strand:+ start:3807 stop:4025 length:219 start_codon:yes stop_codon:yes gene_type:complete
MLRRSAASIKMKNFLIKNSNLFLMLGGFCMLVGALYPDETATDNYIAAAFYIVAAFGFMASALGQILNSIKK